MKRVDVLSIALRIYAVANLLTAFTIPIFFGDLLLWGPRSQTQPNDILFVNPRGRVRNTAQAIS